MSERLRIRPSVLARQRKQLYILIESSPYRYRVEDGGELVKFIASLGLPHSAMDELPVTEQPAPPGGSPVNDSEDVGSEDSASCGNAIFVEDRSHNNEYANYFLVNSADKHAGVTILNTWMYQGELRRETKRHNLYPGEEREVFYFPRAQDPKCSITQCSLE
jgi:hypothetical protein